MDRLRVFVSSPGDVAEERILAQRVIERLRGEFAGRAVIEPIFWEHEPLVATASFQEQIVRPSETEVVVSIVWSRLGTRLPTDFTRSDGTTYASGTEFEFEDAVAAFERQGTPRLLVYRKTREPQVSLRDRDELMVRLQQREALEAFLDSWFHDRADGSLKAAFHPFESPSELEDLLETHLRKLILERLPELAGGDAPAAVWDQGSPFRGLDSFEFEHAPVFFGRTDAVAGLLESLRLQADDDRAFVLVLGGSGGGKSSLVKAGVLPLLTQPGVIEGVMAWRRAVMRPSDSPGDLLVGLAAALLQPEALPEMDTGNLSSVELAPLLGATPEGTVQTTVQLVRAALARVTDGLVGEDHGGPRPEVRLALVIDQLEEIFTQDGLDDEARQAFVASIDALARSGQVWVLATLRSDFYPRCAELPRLQELKHGHGQFDLWPPTPAGIGQIIRRPALAAGLRFERDAETDQGVDEILRDQAIHDPASLPLLEFALEELYQRRDERGFLTASGLEEIGGVEGALARRADEVYDALPAEAREAFPRVLRQLVRVGDEVVTRRLADLERVTARSEAAQLVQAFVEARLFVTELSEDGRAVVSVAHEALLHRWPRLASWLERDRSALRMQARLSEAVSRWQQSGRSRDYLLQLGRPLAEARTVLDQLGDDLPELEREFVNAGIAKARRRGQVRRVVTAALAALALVAAVTAYFAVSARQEADRRRDEAENLVDFMLGDLRQTLTSVGRLDAMEGTNEKVLEYLASLPPEQLDDEALARHSHALRQIGEVRMEQGDMESAAEAFREAATLAQGLAQRDPGNGDWQAAYADSRFYLGAVLFEHGDAEAALPEFETHRDVYEELVAIDPGNETWRLELTYGYSNVGDALRSTGDLNGALASYRKLLETVRGLASDAPEKAELQIEIADAEHKLGTVLTLVGEPRRALEHYLSALANLTAAAEGNPSDATLRERVASAHSHAGVCFRSLGESEKALDHFRTEAKMFQQLVALDPGNSRWSRELAAAHRKIGALQQARGQLTQALAQYQTSLELLEVLTSRASSARRDLRNLGDTHRRLGWLFLLTDEAPEAHHHARAALGKLEALFADAADNESIWRLSQALRLQAKIWESAGEGDLAKDPRERASQLIGPLAGVSKDHRFLAEWSLLLLDLGRVDEARIVARRLRSEGYRRGDLLEAWRAQGIDPAF